MIETAKETAADQFCGKVLNHTQDGDSFFFQFDTGVLLKLTVVRNSVFRFRYTTTGKFENDFSYAISKDHIRGYNQLKFEERFDSFMISSEKLNCLLYKENGKIIMYNQSGELLCEDEKGFHYEENKEFGGNIVKMSKKVQENECYYGMGDKPTHLNIKGKRFENWGTDQYGFQKDQGPLYKNIPFYIGLHHGKAYGIFFDNSFRTHFDFAGERRNVTSFWADGGEMNYYFIHGPEMLQVVERYTDLTGRPELPPLWALGYHQCKWSYYPESKVREITDTMRKHKIPCDCIYLDIDYMDGFRCFTWDKEKFPAPAKMVKELGEQGFKTIVIIDPGIKVDPNYFVFKEAMEKDYFCKRADGPYMKGKVWPDDCYFPDFTNPEVRNWWAGLYKELIGEIGVKGVWNDMNEPAIFEVESKTFPNDVRHDYDGNPCSHRKAHNIYGMQMAQATFDGVKKYAYPQRPFIITRSAYSGAQRFTSTWTGDNIASWEHLWVANVQCQRSAISGFSFIGSDIGGFTERPTAELFVRWIQLGVFHAFCRVHSSGHHGDQEPWSFGTEALDIFRKFIELRYKLLPYIYTTFWQYSNEGTPMLRPIAFIDQHDPETHYRTDEFMLGDHILLCPIQEPNAKGRRMYLPRGNWYNFWTDELVQGGKEVWVNADLDSMPIFIKTGSVLPNYQVMQYVGETDTCELTLHVYYSEGKSKSLLYEDSGDGYDYQKGIFSLKHFTQVSNHKHVSVVQNSQGKYQTSYNKCKLQFHGLPFEIKAVKINNTEVDLATILVNENCLEIDSDFVEVTIME